MAWNTLSLHFKQRYEGAYRYLDRCGEFMEAAVGDFGFMSVDHNPTGAKLEKPELGLSAAVDTLELTAVQQLPGADHEHFLENCSDLVQLVNTHFSPKHIVQNGFASKSFWPFSDPAKMLEESLKFDAGMHNEIGKFIGMAPSSRQYDFTFSSGSKNLHAILEPLTFEKVSVNRHNSPARASEDQKKRVERKNRFADRFNVHLSHALVLTIDLMELEPPQGSLQKHFKELVYFTEKLRQKFTPA